METLPLLTKRDCRTPVYGEFFLYTLNLLYGHTSQFLVSFTVKMSRIKAALSQVLAVPRFLWAQN